MFSTNLKNVDETIKITKYHASPPKPQRTMLLHEPQQVLKFPHFHSHRSLQDLRSITHVLIH